MLTGISNECKIYDQINLGTYWQSSLRNYCSGNVTSLLVVAATHCSCQS